MRNKFNLGTEVRPAALFVFIFVKKLDLTFTDYRGKSELVSLIYCPIDFKTYIVPANSVREAPVMRRKF